jgi:hypothetical protein
MPELLDLDRAGDEWLRANLQIAQRRQMDDYTRAPPCLPAINDL